MRVCSCACVAWLLLGAVSAHADEGKELGDRLRALYQKLNERDAKVRGEAAKALGQLASDLRQAMYRIAVNLDHLDEGVRAQAAETLGEFGPFAEGVIPTLLKALDDESPVVRGKVISALGAIGPAAKEAVPRFIGFLKDPRRDLRWRAIYALSRMGPAAKPAVPALIELLDDPDRPSDHRAVSLSEAAAGAFGYIGPEAKAAVPALLRGIQEKGNRLKMNAIRSLGRIGAVDDRVVPGLITVLRDHTDAHVRGGAAWALGQIGPPGSAAVPLLREILAKRRTEGDDGLLSGAAWALGEMGPAAKEAVPTLLEVVQDEVVELSSRDRSVRALGRLGAVAKEAAKPLIEMLRGRQHSSLHLTISSTLVGIGPAAVPALIDALPETDRNLRKAVLHVLAELGPAARDAADAVAAARNDLTQRQDPDGYLGDLAAKTLKRIQRAPPK